MATYNVTATPFGGTPFTRQFVETPTGAAVPTGIPGNWTLRFEDTFSGTSLDLNKWQPHWFGSTPTSITKGVNSNERSCVDPALLKVANGNLEMRIKTQLTDCSPWVGMPYRASMITTRTKYEFTHGVFEARIFVPPNPAGGTAIPNWPSFWSVETDVQSEIDVLEGLGGTATCNFHFGTSQTGPHTQSGNWTGWHTFAANWQPGRITFYWDGAARQTVTSNVRSDPQFLVCQYATSRFGTTVADGAPMLVDYIRHWSGS